MADPHQSEFPAIPRPGPVLWMRYAYGGRLPERYRDWMLHDATVRTWWLRQAARALAQLAPFVVVLAVLSVVLLPTKWGMAFGMIGLGVALGVAYSMTMAAENVEARLVHNGFPADTARAIRTRR